MKFWGLREGRAVGFTIIAGASPNGRTNNRMFPIIISSTMWISSLYKNQQNRKARVTWADALFVIIGISIFIEQSFMSRKISQIYVSIFLGYFMRKRYLYHFESFLLLFRSFSLPFSVHLCTKAELDFIHSNAEHFSRSFFSLWDIFHTFLVFCCGFNVIGDEWQWRNGGGLSCSFWQTTRHCENEGLTFAAFSNSQTLKSFISDDLGMKLENLLQFLWIEAFHLFINSFRINAKFPSMKRKMGKGTFGNIERCFYSNEKKTFDY